MEQATPMLRQYQELKTRYPDCILFFRLGDFYEMFAEDAQKASKILDVVLTSRDAGKSGRIPMCGIPYHAKDSYIHKLIKAGLKVAICEQLEDPSLAKGLVKRDVVKIITAGTYIDESSSEPRYIVSLSPGDTLTGYALTDTTSGTLFLNESTGSARAAETLAKLPVYECVFPAAEAQRVKEFFRQPLLAGKELTMTAFDDWCFNPAIAQKTLLEHFKTHNLRGFGADTMTAGISSAGALLAYLKQMNRMPLAHIDRLSLVCDDEEVFISAAAHFGLELPELFRAIDRTLCPMGKRRLKYWLLHPLKQKAAIIKRQAAVSLLREDTVLQQKLKEILQPLPDLDKCISRLSCGDTLPKDLLALRNSLNRIPPLQQALQKSRNANAFFGIEDIPQLRELLDTAVNPDMPYSNTEGKIIRHGFNKELDELRGIKENGQQWLRQLQAEEIKRTGIGSLKIGFNSVFGYYIEITKANLALTPLEYIRKQTLANAERFITPALKEFEEKMLNAETEIARIESRLVAEIAQEILNASEQLHRLSAALADLDALYSLSVLSLSSGYCAPQIEDDFAIDIRDGRHPVVENMLSSSFIPNDARLDCKENHLIILTGPNMAGKSTYIRQTAILVIMAQMGSFIPAASARIGLVDKIFTRIGAHDEISKGQSTFMVEMSETAGILNNLSQRSLVILDEIGRGTSTFDGLSLAWAIAEYLQRQRVRTLFATHFHELTALAEEYGGVKNYNVSVKEYAEGIVFLHKIVPGGSDDSYGIYVAKLAGIPREVLERGRTILCRLELSGKLHEKIRAESPETQMSLFSPPFDPATGEIRAQLEKLDINALSPLEALQTLHEWKKKLTPPKE